MTAYAETNAGIVFPLAAVQESTRGRDVMIELLESRLQQLELEMAEQGWTRLGDNAGREFNRQALGNIIDLARIMTLKNPLINRAVDVGALYVWGQDLSVKTAHDLVKLVCDRFDQDNTKTVTGQQASRLLDVERRVAGNIFLALFTNRITGNVTVRPVPIEEMTRIITNPEDRVDVWYYERTWYEQAVNGTTGAERRAAYPDIDYQPVDRPASLATANGTIEIRWDSPVMHIKSGAFLHWLWGVPEVYAALDWATAFKGMLEDDATRSRALSKIAVRITTDGGKPAVDAAKARLASTLGVGNGRDTNPPPAAGATFVGDKSVGYDPIKLAGTMLDPDHSKNARLMVASAIGLPDTILSGDVDQGTLATAKSLDRPTELSYAEDREVWKEVRGRLYQFAIDADLAATRGILPKTLTADERQVDLSFPDLLEPDVTARVTAVNTAAPFLPEELTARLMMTALNVENIDEELAKLATEKEQAAKRAAELAAQQAKTAQQQQPPPGQQPPVPAKEAALTEVGDDGVLTLSDVLGIIDWWKGAVPAKYAGLLDATIVPENPNG